MMNILFVWFCGWVVGVVVFGGGGGGGGATRDATQRVFKVMLEAPIMIRFRVASVVEAAL